MKMTVEEALTGATRHAAASLGLSEEIGRLAPDLRADLQVLPSRHEAGILYHLGGLLPGRVMKSGRWVVEHGNLLF
jgi:imidazolonepropionase